VDRSTGRCGEERPDRAAFEREEQTLQWTLLRADASQMIARFGVPDRVEGP
jgi:hypothetical protein